MDKDNKDNKGLEDICYLCHRPESKAGKIIKPVSYTHLDVYKRQVCAYA